LDDDPLDVIADAPGSNTADIKVFKDVQPAADGELHLAFAAIRNDVPFVNAIEIAPSEPGAIRPIRILARKIGYADENSRVWSSDRYFHNGVLVPRMVPVAGADEQELYHSERVGNFSYVIPVAKNGRYTVTMRFCEASHGSDTPDGAGYRLFDVLFNGRTLLGNFDIFKEAGSLRALDKTFEGLEPNAQGKLIFTFTPTRNYAGVNAIEVMDEAWRKPSGPHTHGPLHR
jgi:Malectin domain